LFIKISAYNSYRNMAKWIVVFLILSTTASAQQVLEGKIVDDETGSPVPFASIGILGTARGTSSNLNGQFSISVVKPATLMITCVGYETLRIKSTADLIEIRLRPKVTQLDAIVVSNRPIDAHRIIRKAFSSISKNYDQQPFLQNFFYRHYCKDDDVYGRLIEASVDVWKGKGYKVSQQAIGQRDAIRVTQLRRSFDNTEMAQGHEPISVGNILETDMVGFQVKEVSDRFSFYTNVSCLKADLASYNFSFNGITYYDGLEVYKIGYTYKKDSVLMTDGKYKIRSEAHGSLFITTDSYAFIKHDQTRTSGKNTIHTMINYSKVNDHYYPYHFVLEGESIAADSGRHSFHIELMSVEIRNDESEKFEGAVPGREELLNIPYDSVFWKSSTILKTTPLEDDIIRDLGGGTSLEKQFYRYKQFEWSKRDGGQQAEEKFNWLLADSKGNRVVYLVFWSEQFRQYIVELELAKQLRKKYQREVLVVFLSVDNDQLRWQETVTKYNMFSDGIINYRIGRNSSIEKKLQVHEIPTFVLIDRAGEASNAKRPSNPLLTPDIDALINKK